MECYAPTCRVTFRFSRGFRMHWANGEGDTTYEPGTTYTGTLQMWIMPHGWPRVWRQRILTVDGPNAPRFIVGGRYGSGTIESWCDARILCRTRDDSKEGRVALEDVVVTKTLEGVGPHVFRPPMSGPGGLRRGRGRGPSTDVGVSSCDTETGYGV